MYSEFYWELYHNLGASLMAQTVKNLPAMQETWVQSLGQEDPLEKEMATHSRILAWRIPWTEEPGGLRPWDHKESDTTEQRTFTFIFSRLLRVEIATQEHWTLRLPRTLWAHVRSLIPLVREWKSPMYCLKTMQRPQQEPNASQDNTCLPQIWPISPL